MSWPATENKEELVYGSTFNTNIFSAKYLCISPFAVTIAMLIAKCKGVFRFHIDATQYSVFISVILDSNDLPGAFARCDPHFRL